MVAAPRVELDRGCARRPREPRVHSGPTLEMCHHDGYYFTDGPRWFQSGVEMSWAHFRDGLQNA
jgi:hypothetical protein